ASCDETCEKGISDLGEERQRVAECDTRDFAAKPLHKRRFAIEELRQRRLNEFAFQPRHACPVVAVARVEPSAVPYPLKKTGSHVGGAVALDGQMARNRFTLFCRLSPVTHGVTEEPRGRAVEPTLK